jgi:hypothetical protein
MTAKLHLRRAHKRWPSASPPVPSRFPLRRERRALATIAFSFPPPLSHALGFLAAFPSRPRARLGLPSPKRFQTRPAFGRELWTTTSPRDFRDCLPLGPPTAPLTFISSKMKTQPQCLLPLESRFVQPLPPQVPRVQPSHFSVSPSHSTFTARSRKNARLQSPETLIQLAQPTT